MNLCVCMIYLNYKHMATTECHEFSGTLINKIIYVLHNGAMFMVKGKVRWGMKMSEHFLRIGKSPYRHNRISLRYLKCLQNLIAMSHGVKLW